MRIQKRWKRYLALLLAAIILITDQEIIHAAEDISETENINEIESGSVEEVILPKKQEAPRVESSLVEQITWTPKIMEEELQEEDADFEQELVENAEETEDSVYEVSYGSQLEAPIAIAFYRVLSDFHNYILNSAEEIEKTEETEEAERTEETRDLTEPDPNFSLGSFSTEGLSLAGEEYENLKNIQETALQNAFDAYYYDFADADRLDLEKSSLTISYTGNARENGSCLWEITAQWNACYYPLEAEAVSVATPGDAETLEEVIVATPGDAEILEEEAIVATPGDAETLEEAIVATPGDAEILEEEAIVATPGDAEALEEKSIVADPEEEEVSEDKKDTDEIVLNSTNSLEQSRENEVSLLRDSSDSAQRQTMERADDRLTGKVIVSAIKDQTYTGKEIKPKITVKDSSTKKTLKLNKQYTVTYQDNINAGTATIIITGVLGSGYSGSTQVSFQILPRDIKRVSAKLAHTSYPYSGNVITPALLLRYNKMTLAAETDYNFSFSSNINVGTAQVELTGKGNYTGSRTLKFRITKSNVKKALISLSYTNGVYGIYSEPPVPTVSFDDTLCIKDKDYKVVYPKTVRAGKNSITVKGMGNYTGSARLTYNLEKASLDQAYVVMQSAWAYTGKKLAVLPRKIMIGSTDLVKNKDYTVKYIQKSNGKTISSVKALGDYQIVLKGKGSCTGSLMIDFTITDKPIPADPGNTGDGGGSSGGSSSGGSSGDNTEVIIPSGANLLLKKCQASAYRNSDSSFVITLEAENNKVIENLSDTFYIVRTDSLGTKILDKMVGNVSSDSLFSISARFTSTEECRPEIMGKYAVAIPDGQGYKMISDVKSLENPEMMASMTESYLGYYENKDITSKKGIQGEHAAYTSDLAVQHVLLNMDMAKLISTGAKLGFIPYSYKGKTYYFSDLNAYKNTIYSLNGWGLENPYSAHRKHVTVVLLMSWQEELSYLIHPAARVKGAGHYYALNMQESEARDTFEALFCYLGETFGTNKTRISSWTLGNEVNCCKAWNYSGNMALADCVKNYAEAFQLLYQGVKRTASTSKVFLSLDHSWNAANSGHSGKSFLDEFASYMNKTAPKMQWNVNYHPYSQPLSKRDFWADNVNTTDSISTKYISMKNIQVLTDYLSNLEVHYGKANGSIRVILGELGFSAADNGEEAMQAAALGYGYYIALFNSRIDSYLIRAYQDAKEETAEGLYFGLRYRSDEQKASYDLYKKIDSSASVQVMEAYRPLIGVSSWSQSIPGFDESKLDAKYWE